MSLFPRSPRPPVRTRVPPGKARSRVAKHVFAPDAGVPPDHRGRGTCSTCHCLGEDGDARHFGPADAAEQYPEQDPAVRALEQRRLGETDDD